ncbi:DUF1611 domain-containing protein [Trinickia violacea]|uniref:DUF1611 domain-containing protein n=1 Tax=Trinickia violacea TaxID=2571746 RepID=A0A4P8J156_9BURK|nr:DUF1611 domain-containing protein [Trinickia violacea]QCP54527.1 DUF1611 domain-containing protein [Trinickia violacea]
MIQLKGRRVAIFADGRFGPVTSKVATSYLRYCHQDCVAVIDHRLAGKDVGDILGYAHGIPVVESVKSALARKPDVLIIGVGLHSNELPTEWRSQIAQAIVAGLDIVSGLHFRIAVDEEFKELAQGSGSRIWDTKEPPEQLATSTARLDELDRFIVHTVGSDCRVGKKTTAIEITQTANRRGINTGFVATGQSGIYISGNGVAVDAVPSDFVAGVSEELVRKSAEHHDWVVVEGQGAVSHPAYSGVTLGLLHGAMPHALILCHEANLTHHKGWPNVPLRTLRELITTYEHLASFLRPAKVVGISVHCGDLDKSDAATYLSCIESETGLPATDAIHFGTEKLVDALVRYRAMLPQRLDAPHEETPSEPVAAA